MTDGDRVLDAWIAEHVMVWHLVEPSRAKRPGDGYGEMRTGTGNGRYIAGVPPWTTTRRSRRLVSWGSC